MSAAAPPAIPPRPVKQQAAAQGVSKLPDLPPRPVSKRVERSVSPSNYPRSPLNEPYTLAKPKTAEIARPPSVSHLPTPGEEGIEYANVQYTPEVPASALAQDANAHTQTRTIAEDLQLHAPKPSLPKASATAQVQGVTRTDSAQAASHGFGRSSHDDVPVTRTRSRQSFSRPGSAASGERRRSVVYGDEHGPAELGLRVPINPLLGDVQAPTPQGISPQPTGDSLRHGRKKSKAEDFRPPDSYGLHGHGVIANTPFERDWYTKHPEQLEHEEGHGHGVYEGIGSGRGAFALSSDELNKIVRDTASRAAGLGTKENIQSYPDEQIGYSASEVYQRSQQNTPHPDTLSRMLTHESQPAVQSPLRRTSFPAEDGQPAEVRRSRISSAPGSDKAVADDSDSPYHIDEPAHKSNKLTGGQESMNETQEAKTSAEPGEDDDGHEYRAPILAEDEVAKSVGAEFLQPAVSPKFERRQSHDEHGGSGAHTPTSRPASRPSSVYQMYSASHSLSRFLSHPDDRDHVHTPLEDVAEYEPLFDESEEKKAISTAERFKKRPDALQKRFPSQDIWEDPPNSAMYVAEVSTPDLPSQVDPAQSDKSELKRAPAFEPPEAEHARKGEVPEEDKLEQSAEERLAKSKWVPHLRDDMPTKGRPLVANRFPSQDIWEDTPDSNYLTTTVGGQVDDEQSSPVETKPPIPARPAKSHLGEGASSAQSEPSVPPQIPARPTKRMQAAPPADAKTTDPHTLSKEPSPVELKKTPSIPDRPKPQIPPRPAKKAGENGLTKVISGGSTERAEEERAARPKPQIPARPAGGNIASLKGNFMSDLNKKLGLGPPKEKEKEPEPEVEAKPLEDARKGRARGPQRRAPAKSPAVEAKPLPQFSMFSARSLWQIDESDELSTVPKAKEKPDPNATSDHAVAAHPDPKLEKGVADRPSDAPAPSTSELATNTAAEPADSTPTGDDENTEGELTRMTTASTTSGEPIDREDSNAQTHMLPVSQMTTASDDDDQSEEHLEKVQSKEPEVTAEDEPIKVRNEQVNAPAPDPSNTHSVTGNKLTIANGNDKNKSGAVEGEDKPKEPMNEDDIDYGKLEEMTAEADGKIHAEEDPQAQFSTRKVVD